MQRRLAPASLGKQSSLREALRPQGGRSAPSCFSFAAWAGEDPLGVSWAVLPLDSLLSLIHI